MTVPDDRSVICRRQRHVASGALEPSITHRGIYDLSDGSN